MELTKATLLAEKVLIALNPMCCGLMIAGSIRRGKADVGDIDIVAIPQNTVTKGPLGGPVSFPEDSVWALLFPKELKKMGLKIEACGPELLRASFPDGFQVDVYRARRETWGVILLVRTGSKEHNVKLCSKAKRFASPKYPYGVRLSASQGIIALKKDGSDGEIIASHTEESIFEALGLTFVPPEAREALL
jgi:DNA polymerase (family 10)